MSKGRDRKRKRQAMSYDDAQKDAFDALVLKYINTGPSLQKWMDALDADSEAQRND